MNNKYGLSRNIPEPVKRIVRQQAGFGCVICGTAICEYEHIDPEWHEAKEHIADKITLLCGSCHSKKTRGIFSREKIIEAMGNPICKSKGFTFDYLDLGKMPIVYFGKTLFYSHKSILSIDNHDILSLSAPEQLGGPYKLKALFYDIDSTPILSIEDNIWQGSIENWDIQCVGTRISIRQKKGDLSLVLNNIPREKIVIEKIRMRYKHYEIIGDKDSLLIRTPFQDKLFEVNFGGEIFGEHALKIVDEKIIIEQSTVKNAELTLRNTLAINTIFDNCGITLIGTDGGHFTNCALIVNKSIRLIMKKSFDWRTKLFFDHKMLFKKCVFDYKGPGDLDHLFIVTD